MRKVRSYTNNTQNCADNSTKSFGRTRLGALQGALLALLFVFVFVGSLTAVCNSYFSPSAYAATSTWNPGTLFVDKLNFVENEDNVTNYINIVTQNDGNLGSNGYKYRTSVSRGGNDYTYTHQATFGTYVTNTTDSGSEIIGNVAMTVPGTSGQKFSFTATADISLWLEGGGSATVTAKAAVAAGTSGTTTPSNFNYPDAQTVTDQSRILTGESVNSRGVSLQAKGKHDQCFGGLTNSNGTITSAPITVTAGDTIYIWFKFYSTDDRKNAQTSRALMLDNVGYKMTLSTGSTNYVTDVGSGFVATSTSNPDNSKFITKTSGSATGTISTSFSNNSNHANYWIRAKKFTAGSRLKFDSGLYVKGGTWLVNDFAGVQGPGDYGTQYTNQFVGLNIMAGNGNYDTITYRLQIPITFDTACPNVAVFKALVVIGAQSFRDGSDGIPASYSSGYFVLSTSSTDADGSRLFTSETKTLEKSGRITGEITTISINEVVDVSAAKSSKTLYGFLYLTADKDDGSNYGDVTDHSMFLGDVGLYDNPWEGAGTSSNPFKLRTRGDFDLFSSAVRNVGRFSGEYFSVEPLNGDTIPFGNIAYKPIGEKSSNKPFSGILEGNDSTLSNVIVNGGDTGYQGLFSYTSGATIRNLAITNCNISSTSTSIGGLIGGAADNLTLTNCSVSGTVTGKHQVGGLVGFKDGGTLTATNCTNSANVTATENYDNRDNYRVSVGGIVGYANVGSTLNISGATNSGAIKATSTAAGICGVGGILGYTNGPTTFSSCTNSGSVSGAANGVGGILGYTNGTTTITGCTNSGALTSGLNGNGGILGYATGTISISSSTNSGTVTAATSGDYIGTGGILGYTSTTTSTAFKITNCTNQSAVSGRSCVGGIVGYTMVSAATTANGITGCKNVKATISSSWHHDFGNNRNSAFLGGIVGYASSAYIANCYNSGEVTTNSSYENSNEVGGIVGATDGYVYYVYNGGKVSGSNAIGGIVGRQGGANTSYAYNDAEVHCLWKSGSNNDAKLGEIVGEGGTVNYSWRLPNSKYSNEDAQETVQTHGQQLTRQNDSFAYYPAISNINTEYIEWDIICSQNIAYVRVRAEIDDGNYFVTKDTTNESNTYYAPYNAKSVEKNEVKDNENRNYYVVDMVYSCASGTNVKYVGKDEIVVSWKDTSNYIYKDNTIAPTLTNDATATTGVYIGNPSTTSTTAATGNYYIAFKYKRRDIGSTDDFNNLDVLDEIRDAGEYKFETQVLVKGTANGAVGAVVGHRSFDTNSTFKVQPRTIYLDWAWSEATGDRDKGEFEHKNFYVYDTAFHGVQEIKAHSNDESWISIPAGYQIAFGDYPSANDCWLTFTGDDNLTRGYNKGMFVTGSPLPAYLEIEGNFKAIDAYENYKFTIKFNSTYSTGDNAHNYSLIYKGFDPLEREALHEITLSYNILRHDIVIKSNFTGDNEDGISTEKNYTYNSNHQGLEHLTLSDLLNYNSLDGINNLLKLTYSDNVNREGFILAPQIEGNTKQLLRGTTSTINADSTEYIVTVSLNLEVDDIKKNYQLKLGDTASQEPLEFKWEISKRPIDITVKYLDGAYDGANHKYDYTGGRLGADYIQFANIQANDSVDDVISYSLVGADSLSSITPSKEGTNGKVSPTTINVGKYSITYTLISTNYSFPTNQPTVAWEITPHNLSNNDVKFGFGDGSKLDDYVINGGKFSNGTPVYYGLNALTLAEGAPNTVPSVYALMYKKINNQDTYYDVVGHYNVFWTGNTALPKLAFGKDYSIKTTVSGDLGNIWPTTMESVASDGMMGIEPKYDVTFAYVVIEGKGNFAGTIYFAFAVLSHDFGGYVESGWGSQAHPYLIENEAHLMRLASIVNGNSKPWDSVGGCIDGTNPTSPDIVAAANESYAGSYFKIGQKNNSGVISGVAITVSTANGFEPIGKEGRPFSANFDGSAIDDPSKGTEGVVTYLLGSNAARIGGYAGLFGYLNGATIKNLTIGLGSTVYSSGNYVGGIAGYALNTRFEGAISATGVVNASGNYVGGIVGKIESDFSKVGDNYLFSSVQHIDNDVRVYSTANVSGASYVGGLFGEAVGLIVYINGGSKVSVDAYYGNSGSSFGVQATGDYVGAIAGKWVVKALPSDFALPSDVNLGDNVTYGQYTSQLAAGGYLSVSGNVYVGGIVGNLEVESGVGVDVTPTIFRANGSVILSEVQVSGNGFAGLLYGMVTGGGYKANSAELTYTDTIIRITNQIYGTLKHGGGGAKYAFGGLFGYISGAGVLFSEKFVINEHVAFDKSLQTDKFFVGGIAGVIGDNATLESAAQINEAGQKVGGTPAVIESTNSLFSGQATVTNTFVGKIAGYVAPTAGIYNGTGLRLFGNSIALVNGAAIYGNSFVGGLFGAMGVVNASSISSMLSGATYSHEFDFGALESLLNYGTYGKNEAPTISMVYGPTMSDFNSSAGGTGKAINIASVRATGYFAGGLIGYVGGGVRLAFKNNTVELTAPSKTFADDLNVYNGRATILTKDDDQKTDTTTSVNAAQFAGGIAGAAGVPSALTPMLHEIDGVINYMYIGLSTSPNATYAVGGLFGALYSGAVTNCVSTVPEVSISVNTASIGVKSGTSGATEVGGLVGRLDGASITNSYTTGYKFDDVDSSRGGVAGAAYGSAKIDGSWAIYVAASPTATTSSANINGKYVLIDASIARVPTIYILARMAGIFGINYNVDPNNTAYSNSALLNGANGANNMPTKGALSFAAGLPNTNYQIALYAGDGSSATTRNSFVCLANDGGKTAVFFKMDSSACDSMIVGIAEIVMRDMEPDANNKGNTDVTVSDTIALKAYRPPLGDRDFYTLPSNSTKFDYNANGEVTKVQTQVGTTKGTNGFTQLGNYNNTFTPGDEGSPFIINSQEAWNTFASNVRGGTNYAKQYIKLTTDVVKVTNSNMAGTVVETDENKHFAGHFDGAGHYITVDLSSSDQPGTSTFPYAGGGSFENLTLKGSVNGGTASNGYDIAGFVGKATGDLVFENCVNEVNVDGFRNSAGFLGFNNNNVVTFVACVNKGRIHTIDGKNGAHVTYTAGGVAGIVAQLDSDTTIESCKNEGEIIGGYNVGGIVGVISVEDWSLNSAEAKIKLKVYNCANTGNVTAHTGYEGDELNKDSRLSRPNYAGGIVGRTSEKSSIDMYGCYNKGTITAYGNIVGGLIGGIGTMEYNSAFLGLADGVNKVHSGGESTIAYSYNAGKVQAGGTTSTGKSYEAWVLSGADKPQGAQVGGIVGIMGSGVINYCYNVGDIYMHGIHSAWYAYYASIGGIVGEADTDGSSTSVALNHCLNFGLCVVDMPSSANMTGDDAWQCGSGMVGYIDQDDNSNVTVNDCYTINAIRISQTDDARGSGHESRMRDGTNIQPYQLTGYMAEGSFLAQTSTKISGNETSSVRTLINASGTYLNQYDEKAHAVNYNSTAFNEGTLPGYIFIEGCLPQLAIFALGTQEGLSMLSVSYGFDEATNDYVGSQAGSEYSPYVIKDGLDLKALSTLLNADENGTYYHFKDKYIEFANGNSQNLASRGNNIGGVKTTDIDMNTLTYSGSKLDSSGNSTSVSNGKGDNFYLYDYVTYTHSNDADGNPGVAIGNGKDVTSGTKVEPRNSEWEKLNKYYNGSSSTAGYSLSTVNYYPAGMDNSTTIGERFFEGTLSGKQLDDSQTSISNLKVNMRIETAVAGLFAKTERATIMNVTLKTPTIRAFSSAGNDLNSVAGGIVGWAGEGTVIDGCEISGGSIGAYSPTTNESAYQNNPTYAGGIVGVMSAARHANYNSVIRARGKQVTVQNCTISGGTTITAAGANIGGIAGYISDGVTGYPASGASMASDAAGADTTFAVLDGNKVVSATIQSSTTSSSNAEVSTKVGGILGASDQGTYITVSNNTVGETSQVIIVGENLVGGIMGFANGHITFENDVVGKNAWLQRNIVGTQSTNHGTYGTAFGGITGAAVGATFNNVTFSGQISNEPRNTNTQAVQNVGGIVGFMGSGTSFEAGSTTKVDGSIYFGVASISRIGGVAGTADSAVFSGTFTITPVIQKSSSDKSFAGTSVGGLIGYNTGATYVRSNGTTITIGGSIAGASEVGGFVGENAAGATIYIGADSYGGMTDDGSLNITIEADATISASGDNVGGLIGYNASESASSGVVNIVKGNLYNHATVTGKNNVGGIIGNNNGDLSTGGSTVEGGVLDMINYGNVGSSDSVSNIGGVIGLLNVGNISGNFTNYGSVTGKYYVGGSIGKVNTGAQIVTSDIADTNFFNYGQVTGVLAVGGSIGGMFGTITGNENYQVSFVNGSNTIEDVEHNGTLTPGSGGAPSYFGGNIGILAGNTSYGQFVNQVQMSIEIPSGDTGSWAFGGSIGIIGTPQNTLDESVYSGFEKPIEASITIANCQFEYNGVDSNDSLDLEVINTAGGIGGVIGVIAASVSSFDRSNNFFVSGNVTAAGSDYVGGVVGLVRASNVHLDDMLLFETSVIGNEYVGGVVGAMGLSSSEASGGSISNSFNLLGKIESTSKVAAHMGGIIGYAQDDTNADTSYWVRPARTSKSIQEMVDKGTWVQANADYNTGSGSQYGWNFLFASDGALQLSSTDEIDGVNTTTGGVDIYHKLGELENRREYWKRIANSYTLDEMSNHQDDIVKKKLSSRIVGLQSGSSVTSGGLVETGYLYAAASAGSTDVEGKGKYLAVATSKPEAKIGEDIVYLHDNDTLNPSQANGPIPARGYNYTYIKLHVNNDSKNSLGNIAIYYRDASTDGSVEAKSEAYTGTSQLPTIDGTDYPEFATGKIEKRMTSPTDAGVAGTYAYYPRLTNYTSPTGAESDITAPGVADYTQAGLYEGYIDIYLFDNNDGAAKPVGSVKFGYEITPRQVMIDYQDSEKIVEAFNGTYYDKAFAFRVATDSGTTVDWTNYVDGAIDKAMQVANYIKDFQITFKLVNDNGKITEGTTAEDIFDPSSHDGSYYADLPYPVSNTSNNDKIFKLSWQANGSGGMSCVITFADMYKQGDYLVKMNPKNTYQKSKYSATGWEPTGEEYPLTSDGNFYFAGNANPDMKTRATFEYPVFRIEKNNFTVTWNDSTTGNIYNGTTRGWQGLTLQADAKFVNDDLLIQELTSTSSNLDMRIDYRNTSGATPSGSAKTFSFTQTAGTSGYFTVSNSQTVNVWFYFGPDAGYYEALFVSNNPYTENCSIELSGTDKSSAYNISRRQVAVSYTDGTRDVAQGAEYTYNAQKQGVNRVNFEKAGSSGTSGIIASDLTNSSNPLSSTIVFKRDGSVISGAFSFSASQPGYYLNTSAKDPIRVGEYTIEITMPRSNNYTFGTPSMPNTGNESPSPSVFRFRIVVCELSIEMASESNQAFYNGAAHTAALTVKRADGSEVGIDTVANKNGTYTIYPFGQTANNDNYITVTPKYNNTTSGTSAVDGAVNAGRYSISIDENSIEQSTTAQGNYKITSGGSGYIDIEQVTVTFHWEGDENTPITYTYNGKPQGRTLANPTFAPNTDGDFSNFRIEYDTANSSVTITFENAVAKDEKFVLTLGGTAFATNAQDEPYSVYIEKNVAVSGNNQAGDGMTSALNYFFVGLEKVVQYIINKLAITNVTVNGRNGEKVYDGNNSVLAEDIGTITFSGLAAGDTFGPGDYTVKATYDNKNVGEDKTITYDITLGADMSTNYTISSNSVTFEDGKITPYTLNVRLNLKGNAATKVYDGNNKFGGDGASNISTQSDGRLGNGFTLGNFPAGEKDTVTVKAVFRDSRNENYYAYANVAGPKPQESNPYKQLVFTVSSSNYVLDIENGNESRIGTSNDYVVNSADSNVSKKADFDIEITQKSVRATYVNTVQSYATSDNRYNTDWLDVTAKLGGVVTKDQSYVMANIINYWQFVGGELNGTKRTYTNYTTIRGSATSNMLKVSLAASTNATSEPQMYAYQNYTLINFPTLVIGYFVSNEHNVFEVGSLASLMIATYYYSVAKGGGGIGGALPNTVWTTVITYDAYNADPVEGEQKLADAEAAGHYIVADDEKREYGYYEESTGEVVSYTEFRQVGDISGKFTLSDIDILNGMFKTTSYGDSTSGSDNSNDWGMGKQFLTNFVKGRAGDVVTVIGSLFVGDFTGVYDGNGYVIDGVNIMGNGGDNAGFFATIADGARVGNVHLRNVNVVTVGTKNVGALAGTALADVTNVSVQGSFTVSGATNNVGGVFGVFGGGTGGVTHKLSNVIAMGTINATTSTYVAGVVGNLKPENASVGVIENAVSMMYIWAEGATAVGGIKANAGDVTGGSYMANSLYNKGASASGNDGAVATTYTALYTGSVSSYVGGAFNLNVEKGTYDVLDDFNIMGETLGDGVVAKPRQSLRLADIIDVYLLMYTLTETTVESGEAVGKHVYNKSTYSWLVGTANGTTDKPIKIANQQGVSLLKELRFATFKITADVYMPDTYKLTTFKGAFFGSFEASTKKIYIKDYDNTDMFDVITGGAIPLGKY